MTRETSHVRHKLKRVLWVPVEGDIAAVNDAAWVRHYSGVGEEEDERLRLDWEELMDMIVLGEGGRITARRSEVLQLRLKAANAGALTGLSARGTYFDALPRGFYLKNFTQALLARHFIAESVTSVHAMRLRYGYASGRCRISNKRVLYFAGPTPFWLRKLQHGLSPRHSTGL